MEKGVDTQLQVWRALSDTNYKGVGHESIMRYDYGDVDWDCLCPVFRGQS